MIPDFKTYIKESVWGDIHKRSSGTQVRKEDSLDNMSIQRFYDYWHKRYNVIGKTGGPWKDMECMHNPIKRENVFSTPIEYAHHDGFAYTYCVEMTYDYRIEEITELRITYFSSFILDYPDFKDVFGPEYNVDDSDNITIVNGKYKFHHYIDIIDKCINMVKKPYVEIVMNESVWADIHKRANGEQIRKEDMNGEAFHQYLLKHYKVVDKIDFAKINFSEYNILSIPVLYDIERERVLNRAGVIPLISSWDDCFIKYISVGTSVNKTDIYEKLIDNFDLAKGQFVYDYSITPKDGSPLTIDFFLKLIDFFVDNANEKEKVLERI